MALILRKNPRRNRTAPKRFEDEKFVSGAIDRYQHCYEANKRGKYDNINGNEDYYTTRDGRKFVTLKWNSDYTMYRHVLRDFTESVLEFTSIWRDMGRVLPGALVSHISSFLKLSNIDQALIVDDDEFVVGDEEEEEEEAQPKKWSCSGLPMDDKSEDEWDSDEETDDDSEWDSDCLSDED